MPRPAEIAFSCPACGGEAVSALDGQGRCRGCDAPAPLAISAELAETRLIERCPACDGVQLYVQRDFNQRAGLVVVLIGAALAPFTFYVSLFVAGAVDALLYVLLPEITVCYRCQAHLRGFRRNPRHQAFDLHVAEQYGK